MPKTLLQQMAKRSEDPSKFNIWHSTKDLKLIKMFDAMNIKFFLQEMWYSRSYGVKKSSRW